MLEDALQLAARRYTSKLHRLIRQLSQDYATILRDARLNSILPRDLTQQLFERASREVDTRVRLAWTEARATLDAIPLEYSPDLSERLRGAVRAMTSGILNDSALRVPQGHTAVLDIDTPYRETLQVVDGDIELFVLPLVAAATGRSIEAAVFVSHIAEDASIAAALKAVLDHTFGEHLRVFVASDYESIRSGAEWHGTILDAIRTAGIMVVLVSEDSYERPWINYEVGAADILGRVVVPALIRGFGTHQLRAPLARRQARSLVDSSGAPALIRDVGLALALPLEPTDDGLMRRLVAEASKPATLKGLSSDALRIARLFCDRSEDGTELDPVFRANELALELQLSDQDLENALDELREAGLLHTAGDINSSIGIGSVSPNLRLFVTLDPIVKGWNSKEDAIQLLTHVVEEDYPDGFNLDVVDQALHWGPRRLNIAARLLEEGELVDPDRVCGTAPYAFLGARVLAKGRRLVQSQKRLM